MHEHRSITRQSWRQISRFFSKGVTPKDDLEEDLKANSSSRSAMARRHSKKASLSLWSSSAAVVFSSQEGRRGTQSSLKAKFEFVLSFPCKITPPFEPSPCPAAWAVESRTTICSFSETNSRSAISACIKKSSRSLTSKTEARLSMACLIWVPSSIPILSTPFRCSIPPMLADGVWRLIRDFCKARPIPAARSCFFGFPFREVPWLRGMVVQLWIQVCMKLAARNLRVHQSWCADCNRFSMKQKKTGTVVVSLGIWEWVWEWMNESKIVMPKPWDFRWRANVRTSAQTCYISDWIELIHWRIKV